MQAQLASRGRGRRVIALTSATAVVSYLYGGTQEMLDGNKLMYGLNHTYMVLTKVPYLHLVLYVPLLLKMVQLMTPRPNKRDDDDSKDDAPIVLPRQFVRHVFHCVTQTLIFSGVIYPHILNKYVQHNFGVDVSGHFALSAIIYINMGAMRRQTVHQALPQPGLQEQTQHLCDLTAFAADIVFTIGLFVTAMLKHTLLETVAGAGVGATFSLGLRYLI